MVEGSNVTNLTKVCVAQNLMVGGGIIEQGISSKLLCFRVNEVIVVQGARTRVTW